MITKENLGFGIDLASDIDLGVFIQINSSRFPRHQLMAYRTGNTVPAQLKVLKINRLEIQFEEVWRGS